MLAYGASAAADSKLYETGEGEAEGYFSDDSGQDSTNSSSTSDPGIPHWVLPMSGLRNIRLNS